MLRFDAERLLGRRFRTYKFIYRFCWQGRIEPERFWAMPFDRLRLSVGETLSSLKVPFATSPALTNAVTGGLTELISLAKLRHQAIVDPAEIEALTLSDETPSYPLRRQSFHVEPEGGSVPLAERIVLAAMPVDPWLDAGLLRTWLVGPVPSEEAPTGPQPRGRQLLAQLQGACRKAFLEERGLVRTEPTTYLNQLALLRFLLPVWYTAVDELPDGAFRSRFELAAAVALHAVFDELVTAAFENPVLVDSTQIDVRAEYLLKTSVSPLSFLRDPDSAVESSVNPYGFGLEFHDALEEHWSGVDLLRTDLDKTVDETTAYLSGELVADAVESTWVAEVRRHMLEVLSGEGDELSDVGRQLASLAADPVGVRRTTMSRSARGQLLLQLEKAAKRAKAPERYAALEEHIAAADQIRKDPSRAFGRTVVAESLVREMVRAGAVFELDRATREIVNKNAVLLSDRRLEGKTAAVSAEYEAGALYRIAGDDQPMLRASATREEGHLFIDLKDFTRKTHSLKEVNMADFLKNEFYGPVLAVARDLVGERGPQSLSLNNLLGDAISFSGDVRSLVEFAEKTQDLLGAYLAKIRARTPKDVVQGELARLKERYRTEKKRLAEKRTRLEKILRELSQQFGKAAKESTSVFAVGGGLLGEVTRATNELYKVEERDQALEREVAEREEFLLGAELTAGVFISFGAPASMVKIGDPVFGEVKVAIAEKINEAARGTARNPEVKRRLDQLVRAAKGESGTAREYPFRVYIDKIWRIPVPTELSARFRRIVDHKDVEGARRFFGEVAERAAKEFADAADKGSLAASGLGATQDLYNAGIAISEEALGAYQAATHERFQFFAKEIEVAELGKEFLDRFVFDAPRIRLVFVAARGGSRPRHVFRHAGSMVFRGFEQATAKAVYELVHTADPFWRLLVDRFFGPWYKAFRDRGPRSGADAPEAFAVEDDEEETETGSGNPVGGK